MPILQEFVTAKQDNTTGTNEPFALQLMPVHERPCRGQPDDPERHPRQPRSAAQLQPAPGHGRGALLQRHQLTPAHPVQAPRLREPSHATAFSFPAPAALSRAASQGMGGINLFVLGEHALQVASAVKDVQDFNSVRKRAVKNHVIGIARNGKVSKALKVRILGRPKRFHLGNGGKVVIRLPSRKKKAPGGRRPVDADSNRDVFQLLAGSGSFNE